MRSRLDGFELIERMQRLGMEERQAVAMTHSLKILEEFSFEQFVTKDYLDLRLKDLEQRIIIKSGSMMIVAVGILIAVKYFG